MLRILRKLTSAARFVPFNSVLPSALFSLSNFSTATSLFSLELILFIFCLGSTPLVTIKARRTTDRLAASFVQKLRWRRSNRAKPLFAD